MQYQAIADRLAGLETPYTASDFEGYLQACWLAMNGSTLDGTVIQGAASADQLNMAILTTPGLPEERIELLEMLRTLIPGEQLKSLPTMSQLAASIPRLEWVWPGWIPRGMVTLMGAMSGSGKSLVALDLAKRIIEGSSFPDAQPVSRSGSVVYVDAEVATTILYERACSWQMDLDRLYIKLPKRGSLIDLVKPAQREQLVEGVLVTRPELVIVDGSI